MDASLLIDLEQIEPDALPLEPAVSAAEATFEPLPVDAGVARAI